MTNTEVASEGASSPPTDFAEFYRRAWPGAVRLASLLTQDSKCGEDLAQDAFTKVLADWSRVEAPDAYLRVAIVNACNNFFARNKTARTKLPLVAGPASTELDIDALGDIVASLPFRQRAVLVLRYHDGLSEAEIAEALGCRPGTVKSIASRALATLKKDLAQ